MTESRAARRIVRRDALASPAAWGDDLHPVLARIYAARAVRDGADIDYSLEHLKSFSSMNGVDAAVRRLHEVLDADGRICVVGDFDADGATSSALMVRALRAMAPVQVDYLVPNRFEYGYGLTPEIVAVAAELAPDLLVTVDNGIASVDGVAAARNRGIGVIVTDHHLPGDRLPDADAIVNPNVPGDRFPSKHLAGVGVAFYLMAALRSHLRDVGWFAGRHIAEPNLASLLDLVALGTVADVVPLDRNNRILVAQGLARIRAGQCQPGITALALVAGRDPAELAAGDLGYALGPRLNAAGRLQDMSVGIECLLTDDPVRARELAAELDSLNRERRAVEADMQSQAVSILDAMDVDDGSLPLGVCLYEPTWHEGVIGILASRIKERLHRPVIAFAPSAAAAGQVKGSARSIAGVHIRDVLDAIATRHPSLVTRFGGHAMAAGLSLPESHLADFGEAFDAEVRRHLAEDEMDSVVLSDGELGSDDLSLGFAELIRAAGPWGQGFPEPLFDGEFELIRRRIVGGRHLKMLLRVPGDSKAIDAIAFNHVDDGWSEDVGRVNLAYRLDINTYMGQRTVQLVVDYVEPL